MSQKMIIIAYLARINDDKFFYISPAERKFYTQQHIT